MLSMTDYPTPKFPATPEEVKAASEKVMNFWVGALSPMWVPFWAASSFGLSAWAMTQNLSKSEGLLKDMPQMADLAGKWPGFGSAGFNGLWGAAVARTEAATQDVTDTAEPVVSAAKSAVETAPKTAQSVADKAVDNVSDTAATATKAAGDTVEKAAGTVVEAVEAAPEPKVAFDPVIEAPVAISDAAVEAPAVLKAAAKTPVKVEPKPIAKAVSAVKKPAKKS